MLFWVVNMPCGFVLGFVVWCWCSCGFGVKVLGLIGAILLFASVVVYVSPVLRGFGLSVFLSFLVALR